MSICTEEVQQVKLLQRPSVRLINLVAIKNAGRTRIYASQGRKDAGWGWGVKGEGCRQCGGAAPLEKQIKMINPT